KSGSASGPDLKLIPLPEQPTSGDINPTSTTPGFNYPTINPQI
ncbi:unnamed protein product, partial [Rotaria sp. Silwood2]